MFSVLGLLLSFPACSGTDTAVWKEEVKLHDGTKMIVERSQKRDGRHEIGQEVPVSEHVISFVQPGSGRQIRWRTEFGMEFEKGSLIPLALYIVGMSPYLIATPAGCIAYNKWERPNPPYVSFRFDGQNWQRIPLKAIPSQISEANLVIGALVLEKEKRLTTYSGPVPAEEITKTNAEAKSPDASYLRTFVREPITHGPGDISGKCGEMVYDGRGGWIGMGWFRKQPSYEACMDYCTRNSVAPQYCPCGGLFKGGK
jgi:hypothetical protein